MTIPVKRSEWTGTMFVFLCMDCAREGTDTPATWEHADEALATVHCWCDRHLPADIEDLSS